MGNEAVFCAVSRPGKGVDESVLARSERRLPRVCTSIVDQNAWIIIAFFIDITLTETNIHTDDLGWSLKKTTP